MIKTIWAALMAISVTLAGCGGGGGGGSATTVTPPDLSQVYQLKSALVNYISSTQSSPFTATGTATNGGTTVTFSGSGVLSQDALRAATFEGKPALSKATSTTGSITGNGVTVPLNNTSTIYFDSNYVPLGDIASSGYGVVTSVSTIPSTGTIGATGVWYSENIYSSSSKTNLLGTIVVSYVIEPDTSSATAILKIIQNIKDNATGQSIAGSVKYRLTPSGVITRLSEIAYYPSANLTMTINY